MTLKRVILIKLFRFIRENKSLVLCDYTTLFFIRQMYAVNIKIMWSILLKIKHLECINVIGTIKNPFKDTLREKWCLVCER